MMNFIEGMKVIFLDIDGVLNSEEFWKNEAQHIRKKKAIAEGKSHDEASAIANMNPVAVERIMRIVKRLHWRRVCKRCFQACRI